MIDHVRALGTISRLLRYPDNHYVQLAELLYVVVQSELPVAAKSVSQFGQFVEGCDPHALEEAYTHTFDVNPDCALEVGWHLFGEDYMRGQFLVRMRRELAKYEIPELSELPDHLTHVLAVIAAMPAEEASRFIHACVFPALAKIQTTLDKHASPYRHLIRCLVLALEQYVGPGEAWTNEDVRLPRRAGPLPGHNGRRPPGMADPLLSYPMPAYRCGNRPELVPLHMEFPRPLGDPTCSTFSTPGGEPVRADGETVETEK